MTCSCNNENALKIVLKEILFVFGRTITEINKLDSLKRELNIYLHRRLNRFLLTALPYFFETEKAIEGLTSFKYVKMIVSAEKELPDKIV